MFSIINIFLRQQNCQVIVNFFKNYFTQNKDVYKLHTTKSVSSFKMSLYIFILLIFY